MTASKQGCGVLFFDKQKQRVLLFLRDNKPSIKFPNCVDILGGGVEENETPEEAIAREMAEELDDLRTKQPFELKDYHTFKVYVDEWGTEQHIFWKEVDFDIQDIGLKEGQDLIWLTEEEISQTTFAFGFDIVVKEFFIVRKNSATKPLSTSVKPGVYRHFKGNLYHVLGVAENTETKELTVIYIPQYGEYKGRLSNRSLAMFLEDVDRPELNYKGPRFTLIKEREFLVQ